MITGYAINKYGVLMSKHICDTCGREFTLTPAAREERFGGDCLARDCPSYDPARDAKNLFDEDCDGTERIVRSDQ